MNNNKELAAQINSSPDPLRSYIYELESFMGNGAHMIQDLFMLREKVKYLSMLLQTRRGNRIN